MSRTRGRGRVVLVGAGPGDPDLITLRGAAALREADAVVYDALVAPELLELAPPEAERINVGKRGHEPPTRPQDEINQLLVRLAREGKTVVRLKGGDPFVFGRGGEEATACARAGVAVEIVPGVSSALAAPAAAGIPVTDRRHSASLAVVTGHRDAGRPWTSIAWERLATGAETLVVLMGMRNLERIVAELLRHGRAPDTPAAVVMEATTPRQRVVEAPLAELPRRVREAGLGAPAVIVVGEVVRLRREIPLAASEPLRGWRVLVTRPEEQAGEMVEALRAQGAEAVVVPMIQAVPVDDWSELDRALEQLASYDAVVFTSANGVRFFARRARERGVDLARLEGRVVCVGPATAETARREGLPDPWVPGHRYDAEGLLTELEARLEPRGRRFLLPRAEAGRELLPEGLARAGAEVDSVVVYRTVPAEVDAGQLRRALVAGELDALTFTSPSTVRCFVACLDAAAREAARRTVIAAIGSVTAEALERAGLPPDVIPARAGARDLVQALAEHAASRSG